MNEEALKLMKEGKGLLFTFKSEAEAFAMRNGLTINLVDDDPTDDDHYEVKGYNANLYWVAN